MVRTSKPATGSNLITVGGKAVELAFEGFKIGKRVTVPLLLLKEGDKIPFKAEGDLVGGSKEEARAGFDKGMTLLPITRLDDGESLTLIVPSVLESALKRVPGGYVGKSFGVWCGPKMPGKRYHQIELFGLDTE